MRNIQAKLFFRCVWEKRAGWEGAGQCLPPGSHRSRNRKPWPAGIYSNSSAPDHIVLSVVHLFWGQALKSLLPENAPGGPASPPPSQGSPGLKEPDPQASLGVPESGKLTAVPAQALPRTPQVPQRLQEAPPAGSSRREQLEGLPYPCRPCPASLSFSSGAASACLPGSRGFSLSISYKSAVKRGSGFFRLPLALMSKPQPSLGAPSGKPTLAAPRPNDSQPTTPGLENSA